MPRIDVSRESEIKTEIRLALAQDPLISMRRLQTKLAKEGYTSASGSSLDRDYLSKLIRKISGEQRRNADDDAVKDRIIAARNRFDVVMQRMFKIAFWQWDYLKEGIPMPSAMEQIAALNSIVKLDIALFEAEMNAGVYKRLVPALPGGEGAEGLDPKTIGKIVNVFVNWGLVPAPQAPIDANDHTIIREPRQLDRGSAQSAA